MPKFLKTTLRFLSLLDKGNNLSLSNIAVIVCLVKMSLASSVTFMDAAAMFIAFGNYAHKRKENAKFECSAIEQVEAVKAQFQSLSEQVGVIESLHTTLDKQAAETAQQLNAIRLGRGR